MELYLCVANLRVVILSHLEGDIFVDFPPVCISVMSLPIRARICNLYFCFPQVVIFVKSVHRCVALSQLLVEQNFPAIAIHRGMAQEER